MYRSLLKTRLQLLSDSLYSSSLCGEAWSNVTGKIGLPRTFMEGCCHFRLGEQPNARSMQVQIVDALHLGERDRASKLLSNFGHGSDCLSNNDFVYILDYCARSPDPVFAMETWKIMEEKVIGMNRRCYMSIIQALSKGGYLKEAFNWLTFLEGNNETIPVLPMYNVFLNGCAEFQSSIHADCCLELMEGRHMGKSEITYWELLKLAVWQQNLSAVEDIWKDCIKFYSPSIISLRKFVWSFTQLGDLGSAYNVLQHMVTLAFEGSASVSTSAAGRYRSPRLDIPIPSRNELHSNRCGMGIRHPGFSACKDGLVDTCEQNLSASSALVDLPHMVNAGECSKAMPENRFSIFMGKDGSLQQFTPFASAPRITLGYSALKQVVDSDFDTVNVELVGGFGMLKEIATVPVMKVLRWSFSDVIHACAQSRNCKLAEQLFVQMLNIGLEPSEHVYDGLVKAVISERGVTFGMKVVRAMEKRNLRPYNSTFAALSVGCSESLELDLAEVMLDQIVEGASMHMHPFNAFLAACDAKDQPECAVRILARMKNLKLKYDIRTYELMFSLFGNVNAPYEEGNMLSRVDVAKRINAIEMDMVKNGVPHSHRSMENLLKALGAEGMVRELMKYLHVADNQFCHRYNYAGTVMYNTALHALVEAKESHAAIEIFKNMKSCDIPPDAATYNIMIDCCSFIRCFKSACALVSMMIRDGFSPETCTYTALIKILLANEDFDEALYLLDHASTGRIQPDVLLFNTILLTAYLKGRIDIVELIVEHMHQEKIQPDPATCAYVFAAYVDTGFLTTAMEALQVLSMRMISEEETVLQEKRVEFEELVFDEGPEAESQIIRIFKDSGEHLSTALLNLRWCAIMGSLISWSPNESLWAKRLSCWGPRKETSWQSKA